MVGIAGDELPVRKAQGDKLSPYTIWGEMALQLGGEPLYQEVKSDAEYLMPHRANPSLRKFWEGARFF